MVEALGIEFKRQRNATRRRDSSFRPSIRIQSASTLAARPRQSPRFRRNATAAGQQWGNGRPERLPWKRSWRQTAQGGDGGKLSGRRVDRRRALLADQRQPAYADAVRVDRDHRARDKVLLTSGDDSGNEGGRFRPSQSLDSHANDRWGRGVRDSEECVKVRVEGDDRLPFTPSAVQNFLVGRLRHSDRAGVRRFETEPTERLRGCARQTLVKQEFHALLGRSITLSSSAAAA